ncbi:MAG: DUF4249 domain-containing protein [Bacteroidales bacterium]|nr:DUF4249 domain-containing protein [Bacteroidales bacterium]
MKIETYLIILIIIVLPKACITPFTAKGVEVEAETLVVDGDIILNGETKVYLSYMVTLDSYYDFKSIADATVWVESSSGDKYPGALRFESANRSHYIIDTKTLGLDKQYKLCVHLSNGRIYESDFLTPLDTPSIESLEYVVNEERTAVDFYVTSYADNDASPFYKWDFIEDWEVVSRYRTDTYFNYASNTIVSYPRESYALYCWVQAASIPILIARTDHLSENIVYQQKIHSINNRNSRLSYLYSMELRQLSLTKEAYNYWSVLKKNTDEIGGLFAPQPNDIYGNIRCVSDPDARAIGYISAGIPSVKRIFIDEMDVRIYIPPPCLFFNFSEWPIRPSNRDLYSMGFQIFIVAGRQEWVPIACIDCTAIGTKNKPSFWPNDHI